MTNDDSDVGDGPRSLAEELFVELAIAEELPAEAMQRAIAAWDECREFFLEIFAAHAEGTFEPGDAGDALFFIAHLFAQQRDAGLYLPLVTLLRHPIEDVEAVLGAMLEETLPRILVAVFDGDPAPLEELFLDPDANELVRWPTLDAYSGLVTLGRIERDRAVRVLQQVRPDVFPPDEGAWIGWIRACVAIGDPGLVEIARTRIANDELDRSLYDLPDLESDLAHWATDPPPEHTATRPIADAVEELAEWHGFTEAGVAERRKAEKLGGSIGRDTVVNPYRGVGRNDPCPCGSGKKFKKCHGA